MNHRHIWIAIAIAGLLWTGACSSGKTTPTESTPTTGQQITEDISDASASGDSTEAPVRFFGIPAPLDHDRIPGGCAYDQTSGRFECAPETDEHGATITKRYAYFDHDGSLQSAFDEASTASIELKLAIEAHPEHLGHTGSIHIDQDLTMSGLAGIEASRVWNGVIQERFEGVPPHGPGGPGGPGGPPDSLGHGHCPDGPPDSTGHGPGGPGGPGRHGDSGGPGGPSHPGGGPPPPGFPPDSLSADFDPSQLIITSTTTVTDLVMPHPLGAETWPVSGSVTRTELIQNGPKGDEERTSTVVYNGTRYASLTVDGETKTVDLLQPPQPPRP